VTLKLIASSGGTKESQSQSSGHRSEDTQPPLHRDVAPPPRLTDLLRTGEALVWWDRKLTINWSPVVLTLVLGLAIFGIAGLIVPELWSAGFKQLLKPLGVLSLPAAFLLLREYFSRATLALTDQAVLSIDALGDQHRLAIGDIQEIRKDLRTGGVKLSGRMDAIVIPPIFLEPARRALTNQMRVRSTAVRFHEIDDQVGFLPAKKDRLTH
jgi:hypothetical protein